jgi:hypothetical protein
MSFSTITGAGTVSMATPDTISSTSINSTGAAGVGHSHLLATNAVTNIKMADDAVGIAELSATGTASSTTYLRGDNTWATISNSGLSLGASGQIPVTNSTTDDFDYTSNFTYLSNILNLSSGFVKAGGFLFSGEYSSVTATSYGNIWSQSDNRINYSNSSVISPIDLTYTRYDSFSATSSNGSFVYCR